MNARTYVRTYKRCTALELLDVKINANTFEHANPEITQILHKHKGMFEGMGNIKNIQVMLDIDPLNDSIESPTAWKHQ